VGGNGVYVVKKTKAESQGKKAQGAVTECSQSAVNSKCEMSLVASRPCEVTVSRQKDTNDLSL
jgi:hypothetical protein